MRSRKKQKERLENIRQAQEEIHLTENQVTEEFIEKPDPKSGYAADPQQRDLVRQSFIEQKIQQAMNEGAFDNLPGAGKPLKLAKNPYADPTMGLAHDILKNNRLAPEWIERDREIRQKLDAARQKLSLAWANHQANPSAEKWKVALAHFAEQIDKLNNAIDDFNLLAPMLSVHRPRLQLDKEVRHITSS